MAARQLDPFTSRRVLYLEVLAMIVGPALLAWWASIPVSRPMLLVVLPVLAWGVYSFWKNISTRQLSAEGVTFRDRTDSPRIVPWTSIRRIRVTGDALLLHTDDDIHQVPLFALCDERAFVAEVRRRIAAARGFAKDR